MGGILFKGSSNCTSLPVSDHRLMLTSYEANWGQKPCTFGNYKLMSKDSLLKACKWWFQFEIKEYASFGISKKLQWFRSIIKEWNKDNYCRIEVMRSSLIRDVEYWYCIKEDRLLDQDEKAVRWDIVRKLSIKMANVYSFFFFFPPPSLSYIGKRLLNFLMIPVEEKTFPGPELSLDGILFLSFFFKLKIWIKRDFEAEEISKDLADW